MGRKITGRRENDSGGNTHYRIQGSGVVPRGKAVNMAKQGKLSDYHVLKVKGKEYLRDNPDSSEKDNIDEQPLI